MVVVVGCLLVKKVFDVRTEVAVWFLRHELTLGL